MSKLLTPRQKLFCKLYASPDRDFFGNGTESYKEVYEKTDDNTASSSASKLLTNDKVLEEINRLLEVEGFNNAFADKQLKFLMTQNADLRTKLSAISEYNKLKARIIQKLDHTTKGKELPTPIMGGSSNNVPTSNSVQKDKSANEEN